MLHILWFSNYLLNLIEIKNFEIKPTTILSTRESFIKVYVTFDWTSAFANEQFQEWRNASGETQ